MNDNLFQHFAVDLGAVGINIGGRAVRKFLKSKPIFPVDDSIRKGIYLGVKEIPKKWTMLIHNRGLASLYMLPLYNTNLPIIVVLPIL